VGSPVAGRRDDGYVGERVAEPGRVRQGDYVRYLDLINSVSRPLPPMPVADLGRPLLVRLRVPVARAGDAAGQRRGAPA
jgi:hypothetical protein